MSTHVLGFQFFFMFSNHFVLTELATSSIRVKLLFAVGPSPFVGLRYLRCSGLNQWLVTGELNTPNTAKTTM